MSAAFNGKLQGDRNSSQQGEDLEALMSGYQQGDPEATAALIRRLSPAMRSFFGRATVTRAYTEDLVQECWLRIHKSRSTYRRGMKLLPWVFGIASHTKVDGYRTLKRAGVFREMPLEGNVDSMPSPNNIDRDLDARRAVAVLPDAQRRVVVLLKIVGLNLSEVAQTTGTSVGAAKQKAYRAYRGLRLWVTENGGG